MKPKEIDPEVVRDIKSTHRKFLEEQERRYAQDSPKEYQSEDNRNVERSYPPERIIRPNYYQTTSHPEGQSVNVHINVESPYQIPPNNDNQDFRHGCLYRFFQISTYLGFVGIIFCITFFIVAFDELSESDRMYFLAVIMYSTYSQFWWSLYWFGIIPNFKEVSFTSRFFITITYFAIVWILERLFANDLVDYLINNLDEYLIYQELYTRT